MVLCWVVFCLVLYSPTKGFACLGWLCQCVGCMPCRCFLGPGRLFLAAEGGARGRLPVPDTLHKDALPFLVCPLLVGKVFGLLRGCWHAVC